MKVEGFEEAGTIRSDCERELAMLMQMRIATRAETYHDGGSEGAGVAASGGTKMGAPRLSAVWWTAS